MIVAMNRLGDSIGRHLRDASSPVAFGLLGVWVNECFSRGTVRLASADPLVDPVIDEACSITRAISRACATASAA